MIPGEAETAADCIGQSLLRANLLEQPACEAPTEDVVHHRQ